MCSESSATCNCVRLIGSRVDQAHVLAGQLQLTAQVAAQLQKLTELKLICRTLEQVHD